MPLDFAIAIAVGMLIDVDIDMAVRRVVVGYAHASPSPTDIVIAERLGVDCIEFDPAPVAVSSDLVEVPAVRLDIYGVADPADATRCVDFYVQVSLSRTQVGYLHVSHRSAINQGAIYPDPDIKVPVGVDGQTGLGTGSRQVEVVLPDDGAAQGLPRMSSPSHGSGH